MVISPVHYIAVPLLAAFTIPLFAKIHKELTRIIPGIVLLYLTYVSFVLMSKVITTGPIVEIIAGWKAPWGIDLVYDAFSGFIASLMTIMGLLIWIYTYRFKKVDDEPALKFYILFLMMVAGSIGITITGDVFNMFVFLEIVGITSYSLTAFYRGRDGAEASFKYLLIGSFASVFLLLGILLLYTHVGTLNMAEIAEKMHTIPTSAKVSIFVMFAVALGIEAEMFPLNGWAPDAYSQAPGPVGAAFSGIVVKAGVYALIRIVFTLFDINGTYEYLIVMGLITMIIAEIAAIRQTNLKRMLAYSSIGQMGVVLIGFGIGTTEAIFAAIFLMFNHAVIKGLLFLSGSFLVYNDDHKRITSLSKFGKKLPIVSFLFALGAFAIVGFPPFAGFWSKLYLLVAAADQNMIFLIAIILMVSVVEVIYYLRVVGKLYFGKEESTFEPKKPAFNSLFVMLILGAVIVVVGVYPDVITGLIHNAAEALSDKASYISNVLPSL